MEPVYGSRFSTVRFLATQSPIGKDRNPDPALLPHPIEGNWVASSIAALERFAYVGPRQTHILPATARWHTWALFFMKKRIMNCALRQYDREPESKKTAGRRFRQAVRRPQARQA
jgi:hypothetical protein